MVQAFQLGVYGPLPRLVSNITLHSGCDEIKYDTLNISCVLNYRSTDHTEQAPVLRTKRSLRLMSVVTHKLLLLLKRLGLQTLTLDF